MVPAIPAKGPGGILHLPGAAELFRLPILFPKSIGRRRCAFSVSHNGPTADAEKAVNAIRAALPKPIIDWAQPMPYAVIQTLFDALLPKGLQWYWKGDFVNDLPDAAIDAHIAHATKLPSVVSGMHIYPVDGHPSVQSARSLCELHDGRRGRGPGQSRLWRQLRTPRDGEEEIRPGQPFPREPEHPPGGLTDANEPPIIAIEACRRQTILPRVIQGRGAATPSYRGSQRAIGERPLWVDT